MTTTQTKTMKAEHAAAVAVYKDIGGAAAAGYPDALTDDQRAAYLVLPELIEDCRRTFYALAPEDRPLHYLCV